ncbi:DUF2268 domain-containing putative Zn-dependent protease [Lysinibacillus sp. NPDC094403]|uniref:DUF2268 domain-containing putative Zn-dependent protease n=1 Tax=Lysinibacillus sp. NPDC094403 TaxID=3390581 RepID=UPI003D06E276
MTKSSEDVIRTSGRQSKHRNSRTYEIIMGGNGLPSLYGYGVGYKLVKSYLDLNPTLTPEEWTALSSKEFFEKGNYLENYN